MIFTKSVFLMKIQKTLNFQSIFGGQSEEISDKNRFENALFFGIAFSTFFLGFWAPFWKPKIINKSQFFEKIEVRRFPLKQYRFEAAFRMDLKALGARFSWILESLDDVF